MLFKRVRGEGNAMLCARCRKLSSDRHFGQAERRKEQLKKLLEGKGHKLTVVPRSKGGLVRLSSPGYPESMLIFYQVCENAGAGDVPVWSVDHSALYLMSEVAFNNMVKGWKQTNIA